MRWGEPKFTTGQKVRAEYSGEAGTIERVEYSTTFGQHTYCVRRSENSKQGKEKGSLVWICEGDLKGES